MFGIFKSNKSFEDEMAELEILSNKAKELMKPTSEWTPASADEGARLFKKVLKRKVECCERHNHKDLSIYQMELDMLNGKPFEWK